MVDKRLMRKLPKPPVWATNAVPTSMGWIHPKTGALLVRRKGLLDKYDIVGVPYPEDTEKFEKIVKKSGESLRRLSGEERAFFRSKGIEVTPETTYGEASSELNKIKAEKEKEQNDLLDISDIVEKRIEEQIVDSLEPATPTPKVEEEVVEVVKDHDGDVDVVDISKVSVEIEEVTEQTSKEESKEDDSFDVDNSTKAELEEYARNVYNYELDRRKKADTLKEKVKALDAGKTHEEVDKI